MTAEQLLTQIDKEFHGDRPAMSKLITSNKRYSDWTDDRLARVDQVLINAFVGDGFYRVEDIMNNERKRLKESLQKLGEVRVQWPFPYENVQEMKSVINELLARFESDIQLDQIVDEPGKESRLKQPYGYLLITIYSMYVIV